MYYCNDCGQFMLPKWDGKNQDICCLCGSADIEKANECKLCKEPIKSKEDYCENCLEMANKYITNLSTELEITRKIAEDLILAEMEKEDA